MNKARDIRRQKFTSADKFLLDANIWLFLQGPQGNPSDWRSEIYSRALADMLAAKCLILVDALVVSEFVNRFARFHFGLLKEARDNFKKFRDSAAFKPIAADIALEVKGIFSISNRIECGFSTLKTVDLLNEFAGGESDFNDLIIAEVCRANNCTLVTHDGDFGAKDLPILTANNRLLRN
jgi:predicted nucleic acid-binding protein